MSMKTVSFSHPGGAANAVADLKKFVSAQMPGVSFAESGLDGPLFVTEIAALDGLFPGGGIPYGQLIEIAGPMSCGKTSLLNMILARLTQKRVVAYVDVSNSFFPKASASLGVNFDRLPLVKATSALAGLRHAELLLQSRQLSCLVLDLVGEQNPLPLPLLHRLRTDTVKNKGLVIFLTEDNSRIIPASTVSLRLSVSRKNMHSIELTVTKSRVSREGLTAELRLYE